MQFTNDTHTNFFENRADQVLNAGDTLTETDSVFSLQQFLKNQKLEFYSYHGSLTTPPCPESVTFMILKRPQKINANELSTLRMIKDKSGKPTLINYRPLQKVNYRPISSFEASY